MINWLRIGIRRKRNNKSCILQLIIKLISIRSPNSISGGNRHGILINDKDKGNEKTQTNKQQKDNLQLHTTEIEIKQRERERLFSIFVCIVYPNAYDTVYNFQEQRKTCPQISALQDKHCHIIQLSPLQKLFPYKFCKVGSFLPMNLSNYKYKVITNCT